MPREPRDTNDHDDAPPDTTSNIEPEALQPSEQEQLDARHLTADAEQHLATHPPTPDDLQTREDRLDHADAALHTPEPDDTTHRTNEAQTPDECHEPLEDRTDHTHLTVEAERYLADHPPSPEDHDARDTLLDRITPTLQEQPHDPTPTTDAPEPPEPHRSFTQHSEQELVAQEPPRHLEPTWDPPTIREAELPQASLTQEGRLQPREHAEPLRTPPDPLSLITAFTPSDAKDANHPSLSQRLAALDRLLDQNPYFRDRPNFDEFYHQAQAYVLVKALQARNDMPSYSQAETAHRLRVSTATLVNWLHDHTQPELINSLTAHETTRRHAEAQLPQEARDHRLDPASIYHAFRTLRDHPAAATPHELATSIAALYHTTDQPPAILFADFKSDHESGPRWMRHLADAIQDYRPEIERLVNQQLGFAPDSETSLRLGIDDHTLYMWRSTTHPDDWLTLYNHEHFYFHDPTTKPSILAGARTHLNTTTLGLSHLTTQLTDHPSHQIDSKIPVSDLQGHTSYLIGETLHFLLDASSKTFEDLQPQIAHVGRGTQGGPLGGIHNPKFPVGEPLNEFRARAYAIIVSDGSIDGTTHAPMYIQSNLDRVAYVKALFTRALGDVHSNLETRPDNRMRLTMTVAVGRLLEKWGMPLGDKTIQDIEVPRGISDGTAEVKKAYIAELIPEEGGFYTNNTAGWFEWKRAVVLDAGPKAGRYEFQSRFSPEQKSFLIECGQKHETSFRGEPSRTEIILRYSELTQLAEQAAESDVRKTANEIRQIVWENPCRLLESEIRLCNSLGINIYKGPREIHVHETGRVSSVWVARTERQEDAIRWAILAPPSTPPKQEPARKWLNVRLETESIKEALKREGLMR